MIDYAVVMTFRMDDESYIIQMMNVNDTVINEASSINMNPLVNGDMAGDHLYNEPDTVSLNGKLSQNAYNFGMTINGISPTFIEVQRLFKNVRKKGILCDIVKYKINNAVNSFGFDVRKNMCLTSCQWTEGINTLGYSMNFTQVLYSNIQTYEVTTDDEYVPNIVGLKQTNFTNDLLNWEVIDQIIISTGLELGFIEEQFLIAAQTVLSHALVGLGIGTGLSIFTILSGGATTIATALGVSGPMGWLIALGLADVGLRVGVCIGIVKSIIKIVKNHKFKIQTFQYYEDDQKMMKEIERFSAFVGSIHQNLAVLNDNILSYKIVSNEDQEAVLNIDENLYSFVFTKSQVAKSAQLVVYDIEGNRITGHPNIRTCPSDFSECNQYNILFRAPVTGTYVYLMKTIDPEADLSDLTNYYIVVSKINPKDFNDIISDIVLNAILR